MTEVHKKISDLVAEIQRLVQDEIDGSEVKHESFAWIDFSDKLSQLFDELEFTFK